MAAMIGSGTVQEMILVLPDGSNKFKGSQYLSSPTIGDYETYLARELVAQIDANSRRLLNRQASLKPNPWQKGRPIPPTRTRCTAVPSAVRRCAGSKSSRPSVADHPEPGLHDVKGGNLNGGGGKTHSVAGFALPDCGKGRL
jgi:hypothetical protein